MKDSKLSGARSIRVVAILLAGGLLGSCGGGGDSVGSGGGGGGSPSTWYVRPADDGNGTDFTYGASDGTNAANAFDGFADIAGIAAGDRVCLPGGDEPFFERLAVGTAGTAGLPITYAGCGTTQAVIWSAQGLSGDRSFNSSRIAVNGVIYEWATVAADIYRKKIDVRPLMLWEDSTWLQPVDINALPEAAILTTLQAGQWGVRDAGDGTYRIYYKATTSAKTPTTTIIRCDNVPLSDGVPVAIVRVDLPYQTFDNIEIRGHTATTQARSMHILDTNNIVLQSMLFYRNEEGPAIVAVGTVSSDIWWRDVSVLYSSGTGTFISPGLGVDNLNIIGGSYSYSTGSTYNGSGFTDGDGDGIGIGHGGGTMSNLLIQNIEANYNRNYGVFIGTTAPMTVTDVSLLASRFIGNMGGCFAEPTSARTVGTLMVKGFVCQDSHGANAFAAMYFGIPASTRSVIVANGIFKGNDNFSNIHYKPHRDNNYQFRNLVFTANPGNAILNLGDMYSSEKSLIGGEIFSNIYFYSHPNQAGFPFAKIGPLRTYLYSAPDDLAAFNTATGATGTVLNIDPLLTSSTDLRPAVFSPLRKTGAWMRCGERFP
jgi:hypothetical protein